MTAAALLAAFVAGRVTATGPAAALPGGPGAWALLLYEDRRFDARGMTTDQMVRLYDAWATDAAERGRLLLAEKLGDEETLLVRDSSTTRAVGAGAEPGVLTGMFIVTAPTLEQALALARETPHHDLGGIVLVREIDRGAR